MGPLSFRQHSGSVDAAKVCNWIRLLASFIEASIQMPMAATVTPSTCGLSEVQATLANMLGSFEAMFLSSICDCFGWQAHSARAAITRLRQADLEVKAIKVEGRPAYKLLQGEAVRNGIVEHLWRGVSDSAQTFYRNRAAVLAII